MRPNGSHRRGAVAVARACVERLESRLFLDADIDLTGYTQTFADEFNAVSWSSSNPKGSANWATGAPTSDKWIGYTDHDPASMSISNGVLVNKLWLKSSVERSGSYCAGIVGMKDGSGNALINVQSAGSQVSTHSGMPWGNSGWVGMRFTPSSNTTISQLGRYNIAGSTGTYDVRIFDATTGDDVAKALVNLNGQAAGWVYASLVGGGSITLQAGHSYYLMTNTQGWNGNVVTDYWYDGNSAVTASGGITVNESRWGVWSAGSLFSIDSSKTGFAQQWGYFEAKVKMPASGTGAWPSFCTYSVSANAAGLSEESDIFEGYGSNYPNGTQYFGMRNGNWGNGPTEGTANVWPVLSAPWNDYHIYGYLATPSYCAYYVDGVEQARWNTPTDYLTLPSYMTLEYNIGGGWQLHGLIANSHMDVDWVRVYSLPTSIAPAAPTALTETAGSNQVNLSWTDNATNETGFKIERATDANFTQNVTLIATTAADVTRYSNTGLTTGTTYYYRVRATNATGDSSNSNTVIATPTTVAGNKIGISFVGPTSSTETLGLTDTAGLPAVAQNDWNNLTISNADGSGHANGGGLTSLLDNSGNTAGNASISVNATSSSSVWLGDGASWGFNGTDQIMHLGIISPQPTITISNISYAQYAVYLYVGAGPNGGQGSCHIAANGAGTVDSTSTYFYNFNWQSGAYLQAVATTLAAAQSSSGSNYIAFTNNTASSITLTWDGTLGGSWTGIAGLQIVQLPGATVSNGVGVNFVGLASSAESMGVTDRAGISAAAQSNWNNLSITNSDSNGHTNSGSINALLDRAGNSISGMTVTVGATSTTAVWPGDGASWGFSGSDLLMHSGEISPQPTITISGIPYAQYAVYLYVGAGSNSGQGSCHIAANGSGSVDSNSTYFYNFNWQAGAYVLSTATTLAAAQASSGSNYIVFNNNTAGSITLTWDGTLGGGWTGIAALQIVQTGTSGTTPTAPSGLGATATSSSQINLSWTDNANNETGFKIERKTGSGGSYVQIATVAANVTSYSDTGLSGSTQYYYRVRATNSVGDSGYSNEANATTPAVPTVPAAPSNLAATASSSTQVNLSWTDNSNNEVGFKIERATDSGFTQNLTLVTTTAANVTSYSNTGLSASTTYYYRVRATNAVGDSANSNTASATTPATIPAAPSGLTATATSASQINLSWSDNSNNETGFKVERATDSGFTQNLTLLTTTVAGVASYSNTGLSPSTTYYYRVRATNSAGDSANSNTANATTQSGLPTGWSDSDIGSPGLAGSATYDGTTWTVKGSGGDIWGTSDQFNFVSESISGDQTIVARVASVQNTDGWAKAGVMFRDGSAAGAMYAAVEVTPSNGVAFQWRSSTGGGASDVHTTGLAAPMWAKLVRSGNNFSGYCSSDGTTWTQVGTTQSITMPTSYSAGLAVTAHNTTALNTSTFTNVSVTAAVTIPSAPSGLTATATSASQINLTWTDNSSNETGFKIERATDSGFTQNLTLVTTTAANVTSYSNTGLSLLTTYYYRVRATNSAGDSANSNTASATTQSGLPTGWSDGDIGSPGLAGSATYDGTIWTVKGSGADIWGASDQFNYVSESVSGDQAIIARVTTVQNTDGWAKAGVMFRDAVAAGAMYAAVEVTPSNGLAFEWRSSTGGSASDVHTTGLAAPMWVKLVRSGNNFGGYYSSDGTTWTQVGTTQSIAVPSSYRAGLAVTAHNNTALNTSTFSSVTVAAPAKLTGTTIGTTGSWLTGSTGVYTAADGAMAALDGDINTAFDAPSSTNGNGAWVGLDLGSAHQITQIKFCPRYAFESRMTGGIFQASNTADFSSGVVNLYTISSAPTYTLQSVTVDVSGSYRYVRYLSPDGGWGNIAELEFDGL